MKASLLLVSGIASVALAIPSLTGDQVKAIFARAPGDACKAPEGSGTCQATAKCKGISYPANLCPKDPDDVQCCVTISCKDGSRSGFCRSVKNNGCDGGKFVSDKCPGPNDIKCCIKDASDPPPTKPPTPPSWPECRKTLSCTFAQIEKTSMQERLDYVRYMQSDHFGPLKSGNQFRAIEGVIRFFMGKNLGAPGTWVSYVDAGIVEGIQRGGAVALGLSTEDGNNPGTRLWADFLRKMKAGSLNNRDEHDNAWSTAEQAATEYGKKTAEDRGLRANGQTMRWYKFTQLFRAIMRNRAQARKVISDNAPFLIRIPLRAALDAFLNWLTDITNDKPTYCGGNAVWDVVDLDGIPLGEDILNKIPAVVIGKFFTCYLTA